MMKYLTIECSPFYIDSIVLNVNRIPFKYHSRLGDKIVRQQKYVKKYYDT